ncbi:MAG: GEVED domain-containing protein, partial [Planctomycetota bacterium]
YDFDHALGFNESGQGALAWVSNQNATPLDGMGRMDRQSNELKVALWNSATKTFGSTTTLTSNAIGDSEPSVHTTSDGTVYVVWLQDDNFDPTDHVVFSNKVMFSVFNPIQNTWSTPTELPTFGLPQDGKINSVAIGTNGNDRLNVLISHSQKLDNQRVVSQLFNRVSTPQTFSNAQPAEVVAKDLNFANLRTTNAPDGSLVAYWMGGDGQKNNVWAASLSPVGESPAVWSDPFTLSAQDGNQLPFAPSMAVDIDGEYQLVYEMRDAPVSPFSDFPITSGHPDGYPAFEAPTMGNVVSSSYAILPELGFSKPVHAVPVQNTSVSGSRVLGQAVVTNSGLEAASVDVEYVFEDDNGVLQALSTDTITLSPGSDYAASYSFRVLPGTRNYGIRLAGVSNELIGDSDNISLMTLEGVTDAAITDITIDTALPASGESVLVRVEATNHSDLPIDDVVIQLWQGDPSLEFNQATLIDERPISNNGGLNPGQSRRRNFNWTVPEGEGVHALTAILVSPDDQLMSNNKLTKVVKVATDISLSNMTATLLDQSGVNNVLVTANLENLGNATVIKPVGVQLWRSLDGEPFELLDSQVYEISNGFVAPVQFTTDGLTGRTGENRYRLIAQHPDEDLSNQMTEEFLMIQGLPDLEPRKVTLDGSFIQDEALIVNFDLDNLGIATADNINVRVFGRPITSDTEWQLGQMVVDTADPLSTTQHSLPISTYPLIGLSIVCVEVDAPQEILELTDMNNVSCARDTFAPMSDLDYGDAPSTYTILLSANGARHAPSTNGLRLGSEIDYEPRPLVGNGTGDDNQNFDDEDGIEFHGLYRNRNGHIQVTVSGNDPGYFSGWVDMQSDGSWGEDGDQVFRDVLLAPGVHDLSFAIPQEAVLGDTYARFRLSTQSGLSYFGRASDGEVEDYPVTIESRLEPPTKFVFVGTRDDNQVELFRSDGEREGTSLLKNVGGSQSSEPHELTVVGDTLFFAATGANGQTELFRTLSNGNTRRVKNIGTTSSNPHDLIEFGGTLFFVATGEDGNTELYKSNGFAPNTVRVKNLSGSVSSEPDELVVMNDQLYFVATSDTG